MAGYLGFTMTPIGSGKRQDGRNGLFAFNFGASSRKKRSTPDKSQAEAGMADIDTPQRPVGRQLRMGSRRNVESSDEEEPEEVSTLKRKAQPRKAAPKRVTGGGNDEEDEVEVEDTAIELEVHNNLNVLKRGRRGRPPTKTKDKVVEETVAKGQKKVPVKRSLPKPTRNKRKLISDKEIEENSDEELTESPPKKSKSGESNDEDNIFSLSKPKRKPAGIRTQQKKGNPKQAIMISDDKEENVIQSTASKPSVLKKKGKSQLAKIDSGVNEDNIIQLPASKLSGRRSPQKKGKSQQAITDPDDNEENIIQLPTSKLSARKAPQKKANSHQAITDPDDNEENVIQSPASKLSGRKAPQKKAKAYSHKAVTDPDDNEENGIQLPASKLSGRRSPQKKAKSKQPITESDDTEATTVSVPASNTSGQRTPQKKRKSQQGIAESDYNEENIIQLPASRPSARRAPQKKAKPKQAISDSVDTEETAVSLPPPKPSGSKTPMNTVKSKKTSEDLNVDINPVPKRENSKSKSPIKKVAPTHTAETQNNMDEDDDISILFEYTPSGLTTPVINKNTKSKQTSKKRESQNDRTLSSQTFGSKAPMKNAKSKETTGEKAGRDDDITPQPVSEPSVSKTPVKKSKEITEDQDSQDEDSIPLSLRIKPHKLKTPQGKAKSQLTTSDHDCDEEFPLQHPMRSAGYRPSSSTEGTVMNTEVRTNQNKTLQSNIEDKKRLVIKVKRLSSGDLALYVNANHQMEIPAVNNPVESEATTQQNVDSNSVVIVESSVEANINQPAQNNSLDVSVNENIENSVNLEQLFTEHPRNDGTEVSETDDDEDYSDSDGGFVEMLIEKNEVAYRTLRNSEITDNKAVIPTKLSKNFVSYIDPSFSNYNEQCPGVSINLAEASRMTHIGYTRIQPKTIKPLDMLSDAKCIYWVLSGTVIVRSCGVHSDEAATNGCPKYMYGKTLKKGSCFVMPPNTAFTIENWEEKEALLGFTISQEQEQVD